MIHPHNDEPDPTAYMGNYNFLRCFLLLPRICTMFVASVNEIDKFKGCPLPDYFQKGKRLMDKRFQDFTEREKNAC